MIRRRARLGDFGVEVVDAETERSSSESNEGWYVSHSSSSRSAELRGVGDKIADLGGLDLGGVDVEDMILVWKTYEDEMLVKFGGKRTFWVGMTSFARSSETSLKLVQVGDLGTELAGSSNSCVRFRQARLLRAFPGDTSFHDRRARQTQRLLENG